jgi:SAM-dependent methyltransferase
VRKVKLITSYDRECRLLETHIRQKAINESPLQILDAGCGLHWPLDLRGIQFTLTGVNIDKNILDLRKLRSNDLNEMIVGDLRSIDIEKSKYDIIYNSYVLEHIDGAERVLDNFYNWLKPGGILILKIPDRNSVWGFVTRVTPFWFHKFHKRYIRGVRNAGETGFGPYPTFHDTIVSRAGIREYCRRNRLTIKEECGCGYYLDGQGMVARVIRLFVRSVGLLSLGKLPWEHNDLTYILEKK